MWLPVGTNGCLELSTSKVQRYPLGQGADNNATSTVTGKRVALPSEAAKAKKPKRPPSAYNLYTQSQVLRRVTSCGV